MPILSSDESSLYECVICRVMEMVMDEGGARYYAGNYDESKCLDVKNNWEQHDQQWQQRVSFGWNGSNSRSKPGHTSTHRCRDQQHDSRTAVYIFQTDANGHRCHWIQGAQMQLAMSGAGFRGPSGNNETQGMNQPSFQQNALLSVY